MSPEIFTSLLRQLRRRAWLQLMLNVVPLAALISALVWRLNPDWALQALLVSGLVFVVWGRARGALFAVDAAGLARHLNRVFAQLEESSTLALRSKAELNVLQRMQLARVENHWPQVVDKPSDWLPQLKLRVPALLIGLALLVTWFPINNAARTPLDVGGDGSEPAASELTVTLQEVRVTPPSYTGLSPFTTDEYSLEVPEGAIVEWWFRTNTSNPLRLVVDDANSQERGFLLAATQKGLSTVSVEFADTSLYRLEHNAGSGFEPLPGVYTVSVLLDRPPTLRLLSPQETRLEIPRDASPQFEYRVAVDDDFGVDHVDILASVAKGSGEGVKFRDERFDFTGHDAAGDTATYYRQWHLRDLGMEPGDEIYLFSQARDNKPGGGQVGRSETLVVRWLDEAPLETAAEGLGISVMPEYFKSQRQIIIETEQLIADKPVLDDTTFIQTSRELGWAQAELKERYGQYLGDEFGESEAPDGLLPEPNAGTQDAGESNHADHNADDHDGHQHGAGSFEDSVDAAGSKEELIARFGHDHGAAEIGIITKRSPVGLMKRAVAAMWEAELKLKLADPSAALPFEQEALRYFDLARQADRIYTRRLGFEPPPVSEDRRLQGELDEISSREQMLTAEPDPSAARTLRQLFYLLSESSYGDVLSEQSLELLQSASAVFTEMSRERPAVIGAAAITKRLTLSGRLTLEDCAGCLQDLQRALWTSLAPIESAPGQSARDPVDDLAQSYGEAIKQAKNLAPSRAKDPSLEHDLQGGVSP